MPFVPGNSHGAATRFGAGNPGRQTGSRCKLGTKFVDALLADFEKHGSVTIERVRETDPSAYMRVIASLLPKEVTGEDGGPVITEVVYRWAAPDSAKE